MAEKRNLSYVPLKQPIVFTVEGFIITRQQGYPLFVASLIVYAVMLLGNITVVAVIAVDAKLHKPMYMMMCNLAACDLLGGTTVMAQMLPHFLTGAKTIGYVAAIVQAFCVHTYGSAVTTILSAMAYDRYVAICQPLHYHAIMTTRRLVSLCFVAWLIPICLITILFILTVGTPLCGTLILHVYCSYSAIHKLACVPNPIKDIYGMCTIYSISTGSFLVIAFSYVKIFKTCIIKQEKNSRSKAIQTCASHLTIYVLFEISTFTIFVTYNLQDISPNARKFCTILCFILPPTVNPIIYGIAMKDIRKNIVKLFKSNVSPK
ncbi:olfactory receptor 52K2-like [Anguilla anguilla]|uniref:olfactory receptor 52K2-like n=1 Tax=Anguilla anguilla TaxID=7936 RepID=UPI0015A9EE2F|nr:olfactory receptor 52K2-like [Anguilla anguilla]XP_035290555.1 olfactory receptor 52K2-like [Anguilla anguilla]